MIELDALWVAAGSGRVNRLERFLDGRVVLRGDAYDVARAEDGGSRIRTCVG